MSQQGRLRGFATNVTETLTGDTGGPVSGDASDNINILGGDTITVDGNPGTHTLTINATEGGYPITPYVVGPAGQAGYATIQAAIDAATLAGGTNLIWVQPGSYTEDLNITSSVTIQASDGDVSITGIHTPPTTGTVTFDGIVLISATHIINSAAAGSTVFQMTNCFHIVTNGYVFNVPNWTGEILMDNCGEASTNDGVINNATGSSNVKLINVEMGNGTGNTMQLNCSGGFLRFDTCNVNCPVNMAGSGEVILQNGVRFGETVTIGGSLQGYAIDTSFLTGASQSIVFNTSGDMTISNAEIASSNVPAIGGTGAGTLTLTSVAFTLDDTVAGTVTVAGGVTYSATLKTDYTDHGVLLGQGTFENVVATAAGTDGQLLIGATGADPGFADLTSTGGTITITPGANTLNVEAAATVATTYDADTGSATPAANILVVAGGTGIATTGAGDTLTIDADADVATSYPTDAGTATPAANALTVAGGTLMNTAGAAATVTVNADDNVVGSVASDSGTVTPTGNSFTVTGANGISTSGSGATLTIDGSGVGGFTWVEETGTTANLVVNQGVIANNGTGLTLTLPATAAQGDVIRVAGVGAGGWSIAQNASQSINFLGTSTTTGAGGSLSGDEVNACIEILCTTANTGFLVLSSVGNFTIV